MLGGCGQYAQLGVMGYIYNNAKELGPGSLGITYSCSNWDLKKLNYNVLDRRQMINLIIKFTYNLDIFQLEN